MSDRTRTGIPLVTSTEAGTATSARTVLARVVVKHVATDPEYHEWITFDERVKADRLGRENPNMLQANWVRWLCNNPDCAASALVSDASSLLAIEVTEW